MKRLRSRGIRVLAWMLAASIAAAAGPDPVAGQQGVALTALAGPAPYDLSGTGTAMVVGFAAELPLSAHIGIETGVRALRYRSQVGDHVSHLMPEVGLRAAAEVGSVRPYLGVGLGPSLVVEGPGGTELTLHGAAGARVPLSAEWALRPEARIRSIRPWVGSAAELTVGMSYRP